MPYEFCHKTPDSNRANKQMLWKDSSLGIPGKYISERCESISCCAYGILFCNHFLNKFILLVIFIILLSLIYNSKRKKNLWSMYMQYLSKSVLKISSTRSQLLLLDTKNEGVVYWLGHSVWIPTNKEHPLPIVITAVIIKQQELQELLYYLIKQP